MVNQQQQNNYQLRQDQVTDQQEDLQVSKRCPKCGQQTAPNADICEHCGAWQLAGQCCFCYAPVRHGQLFCGTCGNAPEGKPCPRCGTHSIFDFCPKCEYPVSKGAPAYLENIKNMPEVAEIVKQMSELNAQQADSQPNVGDIAPGWLSQLSDYEKQFGTELTATKPAFGFKNSNQDVSNTIDASLRNMKQEEIEAAKVAAAAAAAKVIAEREALKRKIADLQKRVFSSNQEARKFMMSISIALPELRITEIPGVRGDWICNYAGVAHAQPSECQRPELGGYWSGVTQSTFMVKTINKNI